MFRGDDTDAFGGLFMTINVTNETGYTITRAVWECGAIRKTFENPVFPLEVNLSSKETKKLATNNVCYLATYDENGKKRTCKGYLKFTTEAEVVNDGRCC